MHICPLFLFQGDTADSNCPGILLIFQSKHLNYNLLEFLQFHLL